MATESPPIGICPNTAPAAGSRGINGIMYVEGFDSLGEVPVQIQSFILLL